MPPKNLRSGSRTRNVDQQNPTETENPVNPLEIDLTQLQNSLATLNEALEREKEEHTRERQEFLDAINELRNTRQPPGDNGQRTGNGAHGDKRRINVSGLDKLSGDISLQDFVAWRSKWRDFCQLERFETYLVEEQAAALRLVLSSQMAQTVLMVLGISSTDDNGTTTDNDNDNRHSTMSPYFSAPQMSITLKIKAGAGHEAAAEAAAEIATPRTQRERPKMTPHAQNVVTRPISPAKPAPPRARIATIVERRIISPPCANPRSQEKTPVMIKESIT